MIKGVIFDMDGVLVDTEPYYMQLNLDFLHQLGRNDITMEDLHPTVGSSMERTYEIFGELLHRSYTYDEMDELFLNYTKGIVIDYASLMRASVKPVIQTLCQKGYKLGLASSSPMFSIMDMLQACEMESYFSSILSGEQFTHTKPNPEIYLRSAQQLGLTSDECVVVEDSFYGIEAGKRAGMYVVAMSQLFGQDQSRADAHIQDMSELLEIVESL